MINAYTLDKIPSNWKIKMERNGGSWKLSVGCWIDNGYGGSIEYTNFDGTDLKILIKQAVQYVQEQQKLFGHRMF
jgi:hypothetical protein